MPCTCILVCTCSRVQVTPMDIPSKQICTPVMFFVCVVCSCTNGIDITYAACKPLCHTPTTSYLITQSFGLNSLTYVPNVFESSVQLCSWYLTSIWKCELWVFLQSNSFEKKQVSTSLHLQSATPDYQTFLRLLTLPWTGTPAVIESGLAPVSQHPITTRRAKSQQSTSPNFVPCSTPGGSRHITQGTRTRSTNPFHWTTACRRRRET